MKKERTIILLFTILALVFGNGICFAQTKRTIHVATAGTLPEFISENEKYQIEELTLTGELNGTDFRLIRDMAGCNYLGNITGGKLHTLDLSDAKIVEGGEKYLDAEEIALSTDDGIGGGFRFYTTANTIGEFLFAGCSSLTSYKLPNGVTSIAKHGLAYCRNVTTILIPNSVTYIGQSGVCGCWSLKSITIPSSVTSIGMRAFTECPAMEQIIIEEGNNYYVSVDGVLFSKDMTTLIHYPRGKSLTEYNIPASVTRIEELSFNYCKLLSRINIPDGVTLIGYSAFSGCEGLTSISLPNSLTQIGSSAFNGCNGFTSITIPNSVTIIGERAFYGCDNLTTLTIGNRVTSIGKMAFVYCKKLVSIVSEIKNPQSIPFNTFYEKNDRADNVNVYDAATLTVPAGTKALYQATAGWNQFQNIVEAGGGSSSEDVRRFESGGITFNVNDNGTSVTVTAGNTKYKGDVYIPSTIYYNGKNYDVTSIGYAAFGDCTGLTSISIPNSVGYIQYGAFQNCSGLSSITLPKSIVFIGQYAFIGCSNLTKIVSEIESPFSLEGSTFDNSTFNNATLTVPAGKKSLYQSTGGWKNFKNIVEVGSEQGGNIGEEFEFEGIYYKIEDNNSVSVARTDFSISGEIVIPNQVAYKGKTYNVIAIGYGAFSDYHKVTSIVIPNSVITIDDYAFSNSNIESVTIPNSVKSIGVFAFYDCSLTSIIIPNSVTSIGDNAFFINYNLKTIVSEIEKPFIISDNVFDDAVYSTATLTIPVGTRAKYQATDGWKLFKNILEEGETDMVEFTIDGATYTGSKSSQSVALKTVDTSLKSVEIPASVTYDGATYKVNGALDHAFDGCTMAALIWGPGFALPSSAFTNASIGSNFLLYVSLVSYAPSSVKNVVVNGTAQTIVLSDDGGPFYCPKSFKANNISYTHNYGMETGGNGKGWETIALPFDVQTIKHSSKGEMVPFGQYNPNSDKKPFWLGRFSFDSFAININIQAYTPYIIAMPNQSSYKSDYILKGDVTFSADNVTIKETPTFSGKFMPAFTTVPKSSNVFAINAVNRYVSQTGGYDAGSRFISNLRDVRPFEAYITESSTRGVIDINYGDNTTDIEELLGFANSNKEVSVYTLNGQKVMQTKQSELENAMNQLPRGVYIVNGKKIVK